ncbi:hypothetical protein L861_06575 [Litchfieldella anticariensis FP35 = DSM 16096]|uniref:Uncharacterized protein n=1 Tax=Litchfieldella anticariensis (strain DSM 16096 / CECT 5854 / CIP 108499 / LMG 22089 / FP35) TaxID=1121939 RepID=S2KYW5_LITA3|nr:hypothetical protein [Halomonas anticariensis]EPC00599.1 hypothetical protein L861_06575 [Halomonas anticariensis FP35 = DSM 16096]
MKTITHAYCIDLDRIVTIDEARFEYLSLPSPRPPRFRYLCEYPACQEKQVRVAAVNDDKPIEESNVFKAPHFRRWQQEPHAAGCPWMEDEASPVQEEGESDNDFQRRLARAKLTDFIDRFDPPVPGYDDPTSSTNGDQNTVGAPPKPPHQDRPQASSRPGKHRTSVLDRLVNTYIESGKLLSWEERQRLELQVGGIGTIRLVDYFQSLKRCSLQTRDRVMYGGANLERRYGEGALFHFFDTIAVEGPDGETKPVKVRLYISPKQVVSCRHRHYIKEILENEETPYYRLYAIGSLHYDPRYRTVSLQVEDLRQLSILRAPPNSRKSTST